ncbi:TolC family protein [Azohydromonas caseinilytica]|uniref:TolC family protein n=1 Tax=Azohydromonas caseinilytica TaxID=2728836 RepID=A0A848FHM9_9BURK|nr:TolC family protein [Azohydromonas caseinilytica]NML18355.1 TolC family protein [Azohydromonas caseinilytica]
MKRLIVSAGLAVALTALAADAPPPPGPLPGDTTLPAAARQTPQTLQAALELAWSRSPAGRALGARGEQALAAAEVARSPVAGPPTLSLSALDDRLNRRAGRREWEAEIGVPLWLPGQRGAQQALAQAQLQGLADDALARRLQLAGELREAWWALAAAREEAALQRARLDAARVLQADVERRLRAGDLARTDANAAAIETQAAEAAWADALLQERVAADRLRALTGGPVPDALPAERAVAAEGDAATHPRLAAATAAVRLAQARLALAARSTREAPEVSLRLLRERSDVNEAYANAVGVRLSVPLGSSARQLRDTAEVRAELLEAQAEEARLQEQLALELETAQRERDAVETKASLAAKRAALAGDTLQLIHKSFSLGESDLPTLLRARAAAFEAQAELRRLEVARAAAVSRQRQALGVLP